MAVKTDISLRFYDKLLKDSETSCLNWTRATNKWGYGIVGVNGRSQLAHRVAWALKHGPIPDGMLVCHTCDNRKCCNPDHLWLGTNSENVADMKAKKRARAPRGETHKRSKLSDEAVREIRRTYLRKQVSQQALADKYGVSQVLVGMVVRGKIWTHVI